MFAGVGEIDLESQALISLIFIVLFGIPHGAIDHLLVKQEGIRKPLNFYSFYIGLLLINIFIWFTFPVLGLISFLLISAYHFGQSQFSSFKLGHVLTEKILYLTWGIAILSGLVYYNFQQVDLIIDQSIDLSLFLSLPSKELFRNILIGSSLTTIAILIYGFVKQRIGLERVLVEVLFFALIQVCFFLLPILIGFTLYFVILHSLKVLIEEFNYLKTVTKDLGLMRFVGKLLPYTLLSILGGVFLIYLNFSGYLIMSSAFVLLLLISSITLPHSIVMEGFYHKSKTA